MAKQGLRVGGGQLTPDRHLCYKICGFGRVGLMSENSSTRILVVDDEDSIREVLTDFLTMEGYAVVAVSSGEQAVAKLERDAHFDAVVLDMKMPGMDGLELLGHVQRLVPTSFRVMMTGFGTVETAIAAMKSGAHDYILKPFKVQDVITLLERGIERTRLEAENIQLREAVALYETSEQMSMTLDPEVVSDILIDTTRQQIDADGVAIWLIDGGQPRLARAWHRASLDATHSQIMKSVNLHGVLERADCGKSLVAHGPDARDLVDSDHSEQLFSLLCAPLRNSETIGVLVAFAFSERREFVEGKRKMLSVLGARAAAAFENARLYKDLKDTFKETIHAFANLLEDKDPYTHGHSRRVSKYAVMIARGMGLEEHEVETIADSALMHDIGKLGIRYEDLNKAEPLTESEYEMFKSHTTRGKWILEPISFLHYLIPGVYHHHERWDGRGYPLGLKGEEIPLMGRILAIADTYDAMTSHRAYRRALPHDVAVREIQAFAGRQFDPEIVEVFVREVAKDRTVRKAKAQRWEALDDALADPPYDADDLVPAGPAAE